MGLEGIERLPHGLVRMIINDIHWREYAPPTHINRFLFIDETITAQGNHVSVWIKN